MGLICITVVFCTGCVQFSYDIEIDNKDRVLVSETRSMDYSPLKSEAFRTSMLNDLKNVIINYNKEGYDVKDSADESGNGSFTLSRNILSFTAASKMLPKGFKNDDSAFVINRSLLKKHYRIHLFYNLEEAIRQSSTEANNFRALSTTFKQYKDGLGSVILSSEKETDPGTGMVFLKTKYADGNVVLRKYDPSYSQIIEEKPAGAELTIKIPVKATKNNAHKVISDKEYQWDLSGENMTVEIVLEYEKYDFSMLAMIFSLLAVVIGSIAFAQKARSGSPVQGL